jgi:hypothetical protein
MIESRMSSVAEAIDTIMIFLADTKKIHIVEAE